jgi:hypothetical protein
MTRLYDPAFTEMDGDIIKHFGMELIEENEVGSCEALIGDVPTT